MYITRYAFRYENRYPNCSNNSYLTSQIRVGTLVFLVLLPPFSFIIGWSPTAETVRDSNM